MWVDNREIAKRKKRHDHDSWMYNLDLNNTIRKFAAIHCNAKVTRPMVT